LPGDRPAAAAETDDNGALTAGVLTSQIALRERRKVQHQVAGCQHVIAPPVDRLLTFIGLFFLSLAYFFFVSDLVWWTKLAIRQFFDRTLNICI